VSANRNLAVGLFVLCALALGIILTVWLTGQRGNEATSRYLVRIDSDVSGLMLGGPVFFMGVQVGTVTDLAIVPGNPAVVQVELRVDEATPINNGTWATLAAQGITGVSVINLTSEPGERGPLAVGEEQSVPVIPYRDSGFSALLSSAPAVMDKLDRLLANANQLLSEDNLASVTAALTDVNRLTSTMAARAEPLSRLPDSLEATLGDIRGVTEELQTLVGSVGPDARLAAGDLRAASEDLRDIAGRLDDWMTRHDADIEAFGNDGLAQVPALVDDTQATLKELEQLIETLRRDPSQVIYRRDVQEIPVED